MKYFCNPVNINYRYQFNMDPREGALKVAREAADYTLPFTNEQDGLANFIERYLLV